MRIKIIRLIIFLLLFIIAVDLIYIQVIKGPIYYKQSVNNRIRVIPLEAPRGIIKDRNGVVLADNRLSFNVAIIPQDIKKRDELFDFLSEVLKEDKTRILQRFRQKKITPFAPVVVAEDVEKKKAMILEENKFRFPGLYIQESFKRHYPFKQNISHVLGYVGKINSSEIERLKDYGYTRQSIIGKSGIEEYYDKYLKGDEGGLQIEVNNKGRQMQLLSLREPVKGEDIVLTIDYRMQEQAFKALGEKKGSVIIMDRQTGEILAMASKPSFDPNVFTDSKLNNMRSRLFTDPDSPLLNRAIQGLYPPGSVFKLILSVAGLDAKKITEYSTFVCPGFYSLGRRRFRCAHTHGQQNLFEGISHSCNVYFYNVGLKLGPDLINKYARLFGLGSLTFIDLPAEERGLIPSRMQRKIKFNRGWYKGDTLNYSIGQGDILITPIQIVRMVATIARKGNEVQPHLIDSIGSQRMVKLSAVKNVRLKEEIFDVVQTGMRLAVTDSSGTARLLNRNGLVIAGKTGTAQSSPSKPHHAWFVGYNKQGQTKVAFCIFLEHGGSSYNAVVIAKDLFQKLKDENVF